MSPEQRSHIEQSCSRLLNAFSCFNDAGEHEKMMTLFTEQAQFARPTDPTNYVTGRDSILATFKARPKDRVTRHLLSNMIIEVENQESASGSCYVMLYTASPDNKAPDFGLQANPSQFLGEFDVDFAHTEEGWKISRLTGEIIFTT